MYLLEIEINMIIPITRRFHLSFAQQTKHRLFEIISEMASHPGDFSNHPETDLSRNRKLDFHNLLQLIVSMEAGSVKDELLKFFSFAKDTASHSAFFQQRAKLSDDALPYLSIPLTNFIHTLSIKTSTSFSLRMGLPLLLPEIRWILIPILLRTARPPMVQPSSHLPPF